MISFHANRLMPVFTFVAIINASQGWRTAEVANLQCSNQLGTVQAHSVRSGASN